MVAAGNSSTSIDAPVPSGVLLLIGPVLIGGFFSWLLYGILIVQIYLYYITYTRDRILIKITVYGLFLVETFQSGIVVQMAWKWMVAGWGRQVALVEPGWAYNFIPITTAVVSLWVQSFYTWRIYALGKGLLVWKIIVSFITAFL
ncbi:hypothetical protein HETIRDRAFT_412317 [Heterobasidion irregulare TC 32-1]|uniref:Uncharacterized protein n=1 Tax=Heterobasidion irregulare (strain TC 32-1) TaxID=747525 RepID=W4JRK7_HETIT|nr:uncharacterized protein HETIRDRAFT_412317 [Heterobasidion irregulare TC 32-1]ETW76173.1 hypothetical protein HETIRDRAFT_412317 [Heterobasidion irregulare TC 32-1]